jgi:phage shock protein E
MWFRQAYAAVVVALGMFSVAPAAEPTKKTPAEVKKLVDDQKAVLIDVREKREWDSGHIDGAISLPLSELNGGLDAERLKAKLPADKVLYTWAAAHWQRPISWKSKAIRCTA